MTKLQKQILWHLLQGGSIAKSIGHGYRLRDSSGTAICKFQAQSFAGIKHLLRKQKNAPLYLINKNEVRKQRGSTWIKKCYKMINGAYAL